MKNSLLAQAVTDRRLVELRYHGFSRTVEPHAYGVDNKGVEKLRFWQVSGGSESGESAGWKLLNVGDIGSSTLSEDAFQGARPRYKRDDPAMLHIYAQL